MQFCVMPKTRLDRFNCYRQLQNMYYMLELIKAIANDVITNKIERHLQTYNIKDTKKKLIWHEIILSSFKIGTMFCRKDLVPNILRSPLVHCSHTQVVSITMLARLTDSWQHASVFLVFTDRASHVFKHRSLEFWGTPQRFLLGLFHYTESCYHQLKKF